ncbi:hypothetical protein ACS3SW_02960 [Roseobacteraceae bacterium S113]
MVPFLLITAIGALWVHYATRWFRYGPPTWTSAICAVAAGHLLATLMIVQFLIRPELAGWPSAVAFALVSFACLAVTLHVVLRAGTSPRRPRMSTTLGLASTTTAITTLPGILLALLPNAEA